MELKSFFSPLTPSERDDFAKLCNTSKGHLQNVMYGTKPCATDLAVLIERRSAQAVRRWELRPHDWFAHWPELIGFEGAPQVPVDGYPSTETSKER